VGRCGLLPGLRCVEALINGCHHGLGWCCNLAALRRSHVALLAVVEGQPKNVAECHERALGRVRFGCLDAVLDGLADCRPKAAMAASALAYHLARAVLRVDGHAHSGRVGDDDAALGSLFAWWDLHGLVL